jgi:hypothetical protein
MTRVVSLVVLLVAAIAAPLATGAAAPAGFLRARAV